MPELYKIYLASTEVAPPAGTSNTGGEAAPKATPEAQTSVSTEEHGPAAAGGLGAIGIDGRALAFQVVNFVILLWILKKVAYKPILGVLEDRRKRIEEGLKSAEKAQADLANAETAKSQILAETRQESEAILSKSREEAAEIVRAAESKAAKRADQILAEATERTQREAAGVRNQLRQELGSLVAQATEVLIEEKLDAEKDARLIEKALRSAGGK